MSLPSFPYDFEYQQVYWEGFNAYLNGCAQTHNPYVFIPTKERAYIFWQQGFRAAKNLAEAIELYDLKEQK